MENIFIKVDEIPLSLVEQYFNNKDLVSIDNLISTLDNVVYELRCLQDDYENFKQEVEDNYKPISQREQIGYDERTW